VLTDLFRAFDATDGQVDKQKAVTPDLLRDMARSYEELGEVARHTADLTVGAYFFAMRACEFCRTPRRGKTRLLEIENIQFRDRKKRVAGHDDPDLLRKAYYVTITFVDQKNGEKFEKRTQPRSGRKWLCPVRAWARAVRRARRNREADDKGSGAVCTIMSPDGEETTVTSQRVVQSLQSTCQLFGGTNTYGFHPHELGAKSIRSGAAMNLSLSKRYQGDEIMVLGRWKSMAFLAYIRPQALEWTALMARDMAQPRSFLDLAYKEIARPRGAGRNPDDDMGIMMSPPRRR
jgi:hypothetical protein